MGLIKRLPNFITTNMKSLGSLLILFLSIASIFAKNSEQELGNEIKNIGIESFGFEENKGQVIGDEAPNVKFVYKTNDLSIFLLPTGIAYQFTKAEFPRENDLGGHHSFSKKHELRISNPEKFYIETYRMDVQLIGANPNATITKEGKSKDYLHYYNHNTLDVHRYEKITYHEIFPNIDWVIYSLHGSIKYDFIVHPGGDPHLIKLKITDAEGIELDKNGNLILRNSLGAITENKPVSFQNNEEVATTFRINDDEITFDIASYKSSDTLVIDPAVDWATYYGGGSGGQSEGYHTTLDDSGNVFLSGTVTGNSLLIAHAGHQSSYGGGNNDLFLVKFNSQGVRQWGTFYGGVGSDGAGICATDSWGNVYLGGATNSNSGISSGGFQNSNGGLFDGVLVKFNSAGTRTWATYLGGSGSDEINYCAVDDSGFVYVTGYTKSNNNIASGGHQNTHGGISSDDAFLVKYDSSGTRVWGTYYGGNAADDALSCSIGPSGNVYVAGYTKSNNNIASGGHQNTHGGGGNHDGFLAKFSSSGTRLWATYYGGSDIDLLEGVDTDDFGNIYATGLSQSPNLAIGSYKDTLSGGYDAILIKFNPQGTRIWASYYGGTYSDRGKSCSVDPTGNVYVSGWTSSPNNIASPGYQYTKGGNIDAFVTKFTSTGNRIWGRYFGGSYSDFGDGIISSDSGIVYFCGSSSSMGIAKNGHQNIYGNNTGFVAFLAKLICSDSIENVHTACNSYTWSNGVTYTASNDTAKQYFSNSSGCDSIISLKLTINYPNTATDTIITCSSYTSPSGKTWTTSGIYQDTLVNHGGCDSILTLNLTINQPSVGVDTVISCDSYTSTSGTTFYYSGTFSDYFINSKGCDSIVSLTVILNQSVTVVDEVFACAPYTWINGVVFTSDSYFQVKDTLNTSSGCDSIIWLNLSIMSDTTIDTQLACVSYTSISGKTWTNSGTYQDTLINSFGCDSIVTLNLTIHHPFVATDTITACSTYNSPSGKSWSSSGTYQDTLISLAGCDSIVSLHLTIKSPSTATDTVTDCFYHTWINGQTYISNNTTATTTLINSVGCDSIITLNLTINYPTSSTDTLSACDSYTWIDGITYTTSNNTAQHILTNANGCDSIITLNLTILNTHSAFDVITSCDSYTWINGVTYTSSNNTATDTLINANGCDSIVKLNLTINNSVTSINTISACEIYTSISGKSWSNSGVYLDTLTNSFGCDSIVTLHLTINQPNTGVDVQTSCDSYTSTSGKTWSTTGIYQDTLINTMGCDSVVMLDLTIINSSSYTDIHKACSSYTWIDGLEYTSSNNVATFTIPNSVGCDSVVTLNLTITTIDTSLSVLANTISSNQTGASYQWLNCMVGYSTLPNETNFSYTANQNGNYAVEITLNECIDTSVCVSLTNVSINESINATNFIIYPNPTQGDLQIDLGKTFSKVSVTVYNSIGQLMGASIIEKNTDQLNLELTGERGVYFIKFEGDNESRLFHIVKE